MTSEEQQWISNLQELTRPELNLTPWEQGFVAKIAVRRGNLSKKEHHKLYCIEKKRCGDWRPRTCADGAGEMDEVVRVSTHTAMSEHRWELSGKQLQAAVILFLRGRGRGGKVLINAPRRSVKVSIPEDYHSDVDCDERDVCEVTYAEERSVDEGDEFKAE